MPNPSRHPSASWRAYRPIPLTSPHRVVVSLESASLLVRSHMGVKTKPRECKAARAAARRDGHPGVFRVRSRHSPKVGLVWGDGLPCALRLAGGRAVGNRPRQAHATRRQAPAGPGPTPQPPAHARTPCQAHASHTRHARTTVSSQEMLRIQGMVRPCVSGLVLCQTKRFDKAGEDLL